MKSSSFLSNALSTGLFAGMLVGLVASVPAYAAEPWPQATRPARAPQNQIQQIQLRITDLYLADFRNEVGLSEDQFLKVGPLIRQFIQQRFRAASQRETINAQLDRLLSQPNPSEADIHRLSEEKAQFDRNAGNMESRFVSTIRAELTPRQTALVLAFNRRFFDEKLPDLLERARIATAAPKPPVPGRPNGNRDINRGTPPRGDAFRGR